MKVANILLGMGLMLGGIMMVQNVNVVAASMNVDPTPGSGSESLGVGSESVDVEFTFDTSISMSLSSGMLSINELMPGNFAHSNTVSVGVNTNAVYGYTLSAKVGGVGETDDSSDLVSSSSNVPFTSLESSDELTLASFDNNKWGYTTASTIDDATTTYSGLLYGTDTILNATRNHSGLAADGYLGGGSTNFTIGANAGADQIAGYYSNVVTFTAVANVDTGNSLMIRYDGNGLYYGGNPSRIANIVTYDAGIETVAKYEKYSHTSNLDDDGVQRGVYDGYDSYNDVVTIPGADSLHVVLTYGGEGFGEYSHDYVSFWEGDHSDYNAYDNYSTGVQSCGNSAVTDGRYGDDGGNGIIKTVECTIPGDTVTFGWISDDYAYRTGYGYYAVVTGLDANNNAVSFDGDEYAKTEVIGAYSVPGHNYGVTNFMGWSMNQYAKMPDYVTESDVITKIAAENGDEPITLYAVYEHAEVEMQSMKDAQCTNAGTYVYDNRDNEIYLVKRLADNECWMLDNLRLDLTDSTTLSNLTYLNTNASEPSLTSLRSGNRLEDNQYAVSGFTNWDASSPSASYNIAKANADDKDIIVGTWGDGSGKMGVFYNYCAATAGSYCYDDGSAILPDSSYGILYDICPFGWHMPQGGYNLEHVYSDLSSMYSDFSVVFAGYFNGAVVDRSFSGFWWYDPSYSTTSYSIYMDAMMNSSIDNSWIDRSFGGSVRCIKASRGGIIIPGPDPGPDPGGGSR